MENGFLNTSEQTSPHEKSEVLIELTDHEVEVLIKNVKLEDGVKEILGHLIIKGEKAPLDVSSVNTIDVVDFSLEDEHTQRLVEEAEKLSQIKDERERIDAVLKLLKTNFTYGYEHVLETKAKEKNISKEELDKFGTIGNELVSFSEMVEHGVGVCGHLSAGYLYLADKAQLKGMVVHSHPSFTPVNIVRTDKEEKLFKSFDVGAKTSNHAWVEIQLEDGTWIPVDPSTEITGTTSEGMAMFQEAKYMGNLLPLVNIKCENPQLGSRGCDELNGVISAGEKDFTIDMKIGLKQRWSFGTNNTDTKEKRVIESKEEKVIITPSNYLGGVCFKEVQFKE